MESRWHPRGRWGETLGWHLERERRPPALTASATQRQEPRALRLLARRQPAGDRCRRPDGSIVGWPHGKSYQPAPDPFTRSFENKLQLGWRPPGHRQHGWHYPGLVGA